LLNHDEGLLIEEVVPEEAVHEVVGEDLDFLECEEID